MKIDLSPKMFPFNPAEKGGLPIGNFSTKLSELDKTGVVYRQSKKAGVRPAVTGPMSDIGSATESTDPATQKARLEEQARTLISQTFFGTMLKQMRDSPFKSDLFEGGRGGQAFSSLYDQKLVEHMSRGAGKKLVDAVVRKLDAKHAYARQSEAAKNPADKNASLNAASQNGRSATLHLPAANSQPLIDAARPTLGEKEATRAVAAL